MLVSCENPLSLPEKKKRGFLSAATNLYFVNSEMGHVGGFQLYAKSQGVQKLQYLRPKTQLTEARGPVSHRTTLHC